jgi:signal transduction histidine kinase
MDDREQLTGPIAAVNRAAAVRFAAGAPIVVDGRLWGVMLTATTKPEPLPVAAESRIAEFTGLVAAAISNAQSRAELTASRARIVTAADETRRRIERDLHDGTQQRLVSLALEVRTAEATVPPEASELKPRLDSIAEGLSGAVEDLQEISRGIHPAILSKGGLGAALKTLARHSAVPVELEVEGGPRLPESVEVAAYYVVSEALTNVAKHAHASVVHVAVRADRSTVELTICDDGVGGADPARGSGLVGLRDRVETVGGTIEIASRRGEGTSVLVRLPITGHSS